MRKSALKGIEASEGETIELKVRRIVSNKEPIKDGAPPIYTERKHGVIAAHNIRTDRWEIATDAMDAVSRSIQAKRDNKYTTTEEKIAAAMDGDTNNSLGQGGDGVAEPIHGDKGAE